MSMIEAAFYGMGLIALGALGAVLLALWTTRNKTNDHGHHNDALPTH